MFRSFTLGSQAQSVRDLARRARRLANSQSDLLERRRLQRYAEDLEQQADRLDRDAVDDLRAFVMASPANDPSGASD